MFCLRVDSTADPSDVVVENSDEKPTLVSLVAALPSPALLRFLGDPGIRPDALPNRSC
jgi:hypothetical protein